ncbi:MAG: site-2 protease family protein [Verrucomicrobiales bacterium]
MNKKWKVGTYFGVGVFVHWTFVLLLGWILLAGGGMEDLVFVAAIFACVVAHEYGHVLMARRYGIGTRDVTLYPIGGGASLNAMPTKTREEIAVALAGPAVNVVIAAVIALFLFIMSQWDGAFVSLGGFLTELALINVILALFNLIPAFPMDGGRVLRAWLARKNDYADATDKAAKVGRFIAGIFAVIAIAKGLPMFFILAAFIYVVAGAERQRAFMERDAQTIGSRWQFSGSSFRFPSGRTVQATPRVPRPTRPTRGDVIDVDVIP